MKSFCVSFVSCNELISEVKKVEKVFYSLYINLRLRPNAIFTTINCPKSELLQVSKNYDDVI